MWSHPFLIVTSAALMTLAACTVGTDSVGEPVLSVASAPGAESAALDASSLDVSGFDRVFSGDVVLSEGFRGATG
jgi:hypothetical protein